MDRDLLKYVKSHLRKGYSQTVIRAHLMKHGYSLMDINEVINAATEKKKDSKLDQLNKDAQGTFYYVRVAGTTLASIVCFSVLVLLFDTTQLFPQLMVCVLATVFGLSSAMMYSKYAQDSNQFELAIYLTGAITSVVVSSVFVFVNRMIVLYQHSGELNSAITYALHPMADPFVSGIVFMLLFCLPSVAYYVKFEKKNWMVFVSYAVWVAVYVGIHSFLIPALL